jgi:phosphate-selective porin OprO/OprP
MALSDIGGVLLWNAEVSVVWDPFHAAAEFTLIAHDAPGLGDPTFTGWSIQAGWFLTGEARAYDGKSGIWANTKPCCGPFLTRDCRCLGALELAARYDWIDLNDGAVEGGEMGTLSLGVNWYLNPNARVMFNFVAADISDRSSGGTIIDQATVNTFLVRLDVHF